MLVLPITEASSATDMTPPFYSNLGIPALNARLFMIHSVNPLRIGRSAAYFTTYQTLRGYLTYFLVGVSLRFFDGFANWHTAKMTYYGDDSPEITATVITLALVSYVVFGLRENPEQVMEHG
jgi:hypothetical protein